MTTFHEKALKELGLDSKIELFWNGAGYEDERKNICAVKAIGPPGLVIHNYWVHLPPAKDGTMQEDNCRDSGRTILMQSCGEYTHPRFCVPDATHYCLGVETNYGEGSWRTATRPIIFFK